MSVARREGRGGGRCGRRYGRRTAAGRSPPPTAALVIADERVEPLMRGLVSNVRIGGGLVDEGWVLVAGFSVCHRRDRVRLPWVRGVQRGVAFEAGDCASEEGARQLSARPCLDSGRDPHRGGYVCRAGDDLEVAEREREVADRLRVPSASADRVPGSEHAQPGRV